MAREARATGAAHAEESPLSSASTTIDSESPPLTPSSAAGEAAPASAPNEPAAASPDRGCPTCGGALRRHPDEGNPYKAGCWHCLGECGTCWLPDLSGPRP